MSCFVTGSDTFVDRPCEDFESYLSTQLVGQPLALQQFSDAVCDHLAREVSTKPLVVSFHGPPGVGKSLLHSLAARALYNHRPEGALQCPGKDCAGYKVDCIASICFELPSFIGFSGTAVLESLLTGLPFKLHFLPCFLSSSYSKGADHLNQEDIAAHCRLSCHRQAAYQLC